MNDRGQESETKKFWDFSPKRGALCFCAALVAAPLTLGFGYVSGTEIGWKSILFASLIVATVAGVWATFTEHIDF